mgnify:CR=1 FL=1
MDSILVRCRMIMKMMKQIYTFMNILHCVSDFGSEGIHTSPDSGKIVEGVA